MNLPAVCEIVAMTGGPGGTRLGDGDAWLAGGTWLYSTPQPCLRRLIDLFAAGWPAIEAGRDGVTLAATCRIGELLQWRPPADCPVAPLVAACADAMIASSKVLDQASIGGNLCLALPIGSMIALCVALDGVCLVWTPEGATRRIRVLDFVLDVGLTALRPGELLRAIELPMAALRRPAVLRRHAAMPNGRSVAMVIGTPVGRGALRLIVTAATRRPFAITVSPATSPTALATALAAIPAGAYLDDAAGSGSWRAGLTRHLAGQVADLLPAAS